MEMSIEVKYGSEWGGWCSDPVYDPYGVGMWRTIRQGWSSMSSHILYEVGDGTREILERPMEWGELSCCLLS